MKKILEKIKIGLKRVYWFMKDFFIPKKEVINNRTNIFNDIIIVIKDDKFRRIVSLFIISSGLGTLISTINEENTHISILCGCVAIFIGVGLYTILKKRGNGKYE